MKKLIEKKTLYESNGTFVAYHVLDFLIIWKMYLLLPEKHNKPGWNITFSKYNFEIKLPYKRMITRDDGSEYLFRINLFECNWFSIKIHKILASDDQCQHDHPWTFISLILKNGYIEHTPRGGSRYRAGHILFRPAKYVHSLELLPGKTATTFVITFACVRKWGFITKAGEWIHWKLYKSSEHC